MPSADEPTQEEEAFSQIDGQLGGLAVLPRMAICAKDDGGSCPVLADV